MIHGTFVHPHIHVLFHGKRHIDDVHPKQWLREIPDCTKISEDGGAAERRSFWFNVSLSCFDRHLLRRPAPELGEAMGLCYAEYGKHASQSQAGWPLERSKGSAGPQPWR